MIILKSGYHFTKIGDMYNISPGTYPYHFTKKFILKLILKINLKCRKSSELSYKYPKLICIFNFRLNLYNIIKYDWLKMIYLVKKCWLYKIQ